MGPLVGRSPWRGWRAWRLVRPPARSGPRAAMATTAAGAWRSRSRPSGQAAREPAGPDARARMGAHPPRPEGRARLPWRPVTPGHRQPRGRHRAGTGGPSRWAPGRLRRTERWAPRPGPRGRARWSRPPSHPLAWRGLGRHAPATERGTASRGRQPVARVPHAGGTASGEALRARPAVRPAPARRLAWTGGSLQGGHATRAAARVASSGHPVRPGGQRPAGRAACQRASLGCLAGSRRVWLRPRPSSGRRLSLRCEPTARRQPRAGRRPRDEPGALLAERWTVRRPRPEAAPQTRPARGWSSGRVPGTALPVPARHRSGGLPAGPGQRPGVVVPRLAA